MYRVVTIALSRDGRQAGKPFGTTDRGDLSSGDLLELLRGFEKATSAEREEAEIRIHSPDNSGVVRSVNGQLMLRTAREAHLREHPLGPMDIVEHLDRSTTWTPFVPKPAEATATTSPVPVPVPREFPNLRQPTLAGLILSLIAFLGGAIGLCVAIRVGFRKPPVDPAPLLSPFQERNEQQAVAKNVVGTYSTGPAVGDRTITVKAGGALEFDTIGAKGMIDQVLDTYVLALRQDAPCLSTGHNGLIDLQGTDTLVYSRDLYHRVP